MSRKRQDEARATDRPATAGAAGEAGLDDRDLDQVDGGFTPYSPFQGGVRVASGDITGDGNPDLVVPEEPDSGLNKR